MRSIVAEFLPLYRLTFTQLQSPQTLQAMADQLAQAAETLAYEGQAAEGRLIVEALWALEQQVQQPVESSAPIRDALAHMGQWVPR